MTFNIIITTNLHAKIQNFLTLSTRSDSKLERSTLYFWIRKISISGVDFTATKLAVRSRGRVAPFAAMSPTQDCKHLNTVQAVTTLVVRGGYFMTL